MKDLILNEIYNHDQTSPIKGRVLGEKFGITDANVRQFINELRCEGHPIAAETSKTGRKGYWYAKTEAELEHTDRSMLSRINSMQQASVGMFKPFRKQDQLSLSF